MTKKVADGLTETLSKTQLQTLVTITGVVVALLNVWIVSKIAPVAQDIAVITARVDAIEKEQDTEHNNLYSRLERIENKLDTLLER